MTNNLIVDVNSINSVIAKVDTLWTEAQSGNYKLLVPAANRYQKLSSMSVAQGQKDFKIEAAAISSKTPVNAFYKITGHGTSTLECVYKFQNNFTQTPVVTVTYDGNWAGGIVAIRTDVAVDRSGGANDLLTIYLRRINAGTTVKAWGTNDSFNIHVIAMGV